MNTAEKKKLPRNVKELKTNDLGAAFYSELVGAFSLANRNSLSGPTLNYTQLCDHSSHSTVDTEREREKRRVSIGLPQKFDSSVGFPVAAR